MKPIVVLLEESGVNLDALAKTAGLETKLVKSIASGNYTPSPAQRERLAAALGVSKDDVSWDHSVPVHHLRGNGPQCGRPT